MKRTYSREQVPNPLEVLRKAGYSYFRDPLSGEESFVIRLSPEFYPRFHMYVEDKDDKVVFSLHLDQKKPSYGQGHQHAGEYEGSTVEKEMDRVEGWAKQVSRAQGDTDDNDVDLKNKEQQIEQGKQLKSFWKKIKHSLFGN